MEDSPLRRNSSQVSRTSSHRASRQSSTVRVRREKHTSPLYVERPRTPDEQSLTSFPSLSPSLESSPHVLNATSDHARDRRRSYDQSKAGATLRSTSSALDDLFNNSDSIGRISLFDDTPRAVRNVPGTIHHQTDEQIQSMLARIGPVNLVRQMAEDLARRDAQATMLQRRAEERERLLRRMLQECEVSNLDIERRMREVSSYPDGCSSASAKSEGASLHRIADFGVDEAINKRIAEALQDSVVGQGSDNSTANFQRSRTSSTQSDAAESLNVKPTTEGQPIQSTANRGWRNYFKTSTTQSDASSLDTKTSSSTSNLNASRNASSTDMASSKTLNSDVFRPPPLVKRSSSAMESLRADLSKNSQKSQEHTRSTAQKPASTSVASWALKFVTGRSTPPENHKSNEAVTRVRASTASQVPHKDVKTVRSSRSGQSVSGNHKSQVTASKPIAASAFGPNGTIRGNRGDSQRHPMTGMFPSSSPPRSNDAEDSSPGPVEMDTILPGDIRPPTLAPFENGLLADAEGLLTDRFGFIYDQRRRKRQSNTASVSDRGRQAVRVETLENHRRPLSPLSRNDGDANSVTSKGSMTIRPGSPGSNEDRSSVKARWQDPFKFASPQGELLSHTPATGPLISVDVQDDILGPPTETPKHKLSKSGSVSAFSPNPEPTANRVSSENAELAHPFESKTVPQTLGRGDSTSPGETHNQDPVKALLDQLTEVHDSLQKEKTTKWNEFLKKTRAERKTKGDANISQDRRSKAFAAPETLMPEGEVIGIASLGTNGKGGKAKWNEFRSLVLRGIPVVYRAKIWAECSGAAELKIPGYYDDLVSRNDVDPVIVQQIQMDITRTLTDNIFFRRGSGVRKLREVLLAYALRNPEIGYCQGMNLITAHLLLIMPTAEDAFWILTSMIENILPEKYYNSSLLTSRADQLVLRQYVAELLPQLSSHLDSLSIELEALTFQWFLSVFTDCLSAEALFRVWDVVLCMHDGSTFLFQVALALLKLNEKQLLACDNPAEIYAYINQRMTDHAISIDGLIRASEGLKKVVRGDEVRLRRKEAVEHEEEAIRVREAIRKGKSIARPKQEEIEARSPTPINHLDNDHRTSAKLANETTPDRSRSQLDSEEEAPYGEDELIIRTPMPVDEEIQWRQ